MEKKDIGQRPKEKRKMKKLRINVAVADSEIMIQTVKEGFADDTSSILEIVGILEDIKSDYISRLKTKGRVTTKE